MPTVFTSRFEEVGNHDHLHMQGVSQPFNLQMKRVSQLCLSPDEKG